MHIVFTVINGHGIGDNLRGIISMLQIQQKLNKQKKFTLHIDFSQSRIYNYILHRIPDYISTISNNNDLKLMYYGDEKSHDDDIINFILQENLNVLYISTNTYPDINNITDDMKSIIKDLFKFNTYFDNMLKQYIQDIPENYNLFHYRLGDQELKGETDEVRINTALELFKEHVKNYKNCLVISDSFYFKQKLYDMYQNKDVFVFLTKPSHTCDHYNRHNDIDIFIDFFLIIHAKTMNCYSFYPWISNFVYWTSFIYNIPCKNLK